ncbi:MAG: hypothetical protein ABIJ23_01570 [Candidatus Magasanikbacteria bacterium]
MENSEKRKPREILEDKDLNVGPLSEEEVDFYHEQMRNLHTSEWQRNNLCNDPSDPACQVDKFDLRETICVRDQKKLLAMINTLTVKAENFSEVCALFPKYADVINTSEQNVQKEKLVEKPDYRLCFSITASRTSQGGGYSVSTESGEKIPLATFLLQQIPKDNQRIIAFSCFGNVNDDIDTGNPEQMLAFYQKNIQGAYEDESKDSARALGATWTHTKAGNALEAGILLNSRPKDKLGGQANVLCAYPRNEEEAKLFDDIRQKRQAGEIQYVLENGNIIFTDIAV